MKNEWFLTGDFPPVGEKVLLAIHDGSNLNWVDATVGSIMYQSGGQKYVYLTLNGGRTHFAECNPLKLRPAIIKPERYVPKEGDEFYINHRSDKGENHGLLFCVHANDKGVAFEYLSGEFKGGLDVCSTSCQFIKVSELPF